MTTPAAHGAPRLPDADVYGVQKQTALERYTRRPLNVDFIDYIEQGGGSMDDLIWAHQAHVETRQLLEATLRELGWSYCIWNLDELNEMHLPFYVSKLPQVSLSPRQKIVLTLGGDGTLLHASHYVGGDVAIFGINSCVEHSVGALCFATRTTLCNALFRLHQEKLVPKRIARLRTTTSETGQVPLALNDILLCNQHPAATSRYQIFVENLYTPNSAQQDGNCEKFSAEHHLSSGIWISTAAGSSAAIKSYGLPKLDISSTQFLLAVREPYVAHTRAQESSSYKLDKLLLSSDHQVSLFSRMRAGLVCVDGPDNGLLLGFGSKITVDSPADAGLLLYL